ncbi:DUF3299 domain-containing protein [Ruegeria sp. Ofav3-42]|uniref:DUF3299 domain-containing protein n=1 Tax=Ruegeria sp. Ofav3-42 TaxID=2917759 RepID=UPI001EF643C8|nr:DUF3299 domain-containing protein [Ruegeria sp. Ofav3-42]MCG7522790.1 DUF3299 domain-containing protein [Ruegeria sp. Ofav3-42]
MRMLVTGLLSVLLAASVNANPRVVSWSDLVDTSAQSYEDPFKDLGASDLVNLKVVVRVRQLLKNGLADQEELERAKSRLEDAESALIMAGVDIDWYVSQRFVVAERRERAAKSGNPEVNGQQVTISGFAIPAPPNSDGTKMAYLVPQLGMCSHLPPPPPNQLVRLRLSEGESAVRLYERMQVTGQIQIEQSSETVFVVDGLQKMEATWSLEVASSERLSTLQSNPHSGLRPLLLRNRKSASGKYRLKPKADLN